MLSVQTTFPCLAGGTVHTADLTMLGRTSSRKSFLHNDLPIITENRRKVKCPNGLRQALDNRRKLWYNKGLGPAAGGAS